MVWQMGTCEELDRDLYEQSCANIEPTCNGIVEVDVHETYSLQQGEGNPDKHIVVQDRYIVLKEQAGARQQIEKGLFDGPTANPKHSQLPGKENFASAEEPASDSYVDSPSEVWRLHPTLPQLFIKSNASWQANEEKEDNHRPTQDTGACEPVAVEVATYACAHQVEVPCNGNGALDGDGEASDSDTVEVPTYSSSSRLGQMPVCGQSGKQNEDALSVSDEEQPIEVARIDDEYQEWSKVREQLAELEDTDSDDDDDDLMEEAEEESGSAATSALSKPSEGESTDRQGNSREENEMGAERHASVETGGDRLSCFPSEPVLMADETEKRSISTQAAAAKPSASDSCVREDEVGRAAVSCRENHPESTHGDNEEAVDLSGTGPPHHRTAADHAPHAPETHGDEKAEDDEEPSPTETVAGKKVSSDDDRVHEQASHHKDYEEVSEKPVQSCDKAEDEEEDAKTSVEVKAIVMDGAADSHTDDKPEPAAVSEESPEDTVEEAVAREDQSPNHEQREEPHSDVLGKDVASEANAKQSQQASHSGVEADKVHEADDAGNGELAKPTLDTSVHKDCEAGPEDEHDHCAYSPAELAEDEGVKDDECVHPSPDAKAHQDVADDADAKDAGEHTRHETGTAEGGEHLKPVTVVEPAAHTSTEKDDACEAGAEDEHDHAAHSPVEHAVHEAEGVKDDECVHSSPDAKAHQDVADCEDAKDAGEHTSHETGNAEGGEHVKPDTVVEPASHTLAKKVGAGEAGAEHDHAAHSPAVHEAEEVKDGECMRAGLDAEAQQGASDGLGETGVNEQARNGTTAVEDRGPVEHRGEMKVVEEADARGGPNNWDPHEHHSGFQDMAALKQAVQDAEAEDEDEASAIESGQEEDASVENEFKAGPLHAEEECHCLNEARDGTDRVKEVLRSGEGTSSLADENNLQQCHEAAREQQAQARPRDQGDVDGPDHRLAGFGSLLPEGSSGNAVVAESDGAAEGSVAGHVEKADQGNETQMKADAHTSVTVPVENGHTVDTHAQTGAQMEVKDTPQKDSTEIRSEASTHSEKDVKVSPGVAEKMLMFEGTQTQAEETKDNSASLPEQESPATTDLQDSSSFSVPEAIKYFDGFFEDADARPHSQSHQLSAGGDAADHVVPNACDQESGEHDGTIGRKEPNSLLMNGCTDGLEKDEGAATESGSISASQEDKNVSKARHSTPPRSVSEDEQDESGAQDKPDSPVTASPFPESLGVKKDEAQGESGTISVETQREKDVNEDRQTQRSGWPARVGRMALKVLRIVAAGSVLVYMGKTGAFSFEDVTQRVRDSEHAYAHIRTSKRKREQEAQEDSEVKEAKMIELGLKSVTVNEGDTLSELVVKYVGKYSEENMQKLVNLNPEELKNPEFLAVGASLVVPNRVSESEAFEQLHARLPPGSAEPLTNYRRRIIDPVTEVVTPVDSDKHSGKKSKGKRLANSEECGKAAVEEASAMADPETTREIASSLMRTAGDASWKGIDDPLPVRTAPTPAENAAPASDCKSGKGNSADSQTVGPPEVCLTYFEG